jgi:site-specific DNA-methyltransferase (adenine-specific)
MNGMNEMEIYNGDCIDVNKRIADESVTLGIYDPPFGIGEAGFDRHYKRDSKNVIEGYQEAPQDYRQWTLDWMREAKRVLHPNGSMFVIIGHTNLIHVLNAAVELDLPMINHIIWKYNFGVNTKKKFVTSHYHVLYFAKSLTANRIFNVNCRFGNQEIAADGGKALYDDLEDVFVINKEYAPDEKKNQNKLPEELIQKLILYTSNEGDVVCDFFMGNFTTAKVARKLGRKVCGYEINPESFAYHMDRVAAIEFGCELKNLKSVVNIVPKNQGKKITPEEAKSIRDDYTAMLATGMKKKDASTKLQEKYGRGKFAIKNILDKQENAQ